MATTAPSKTPHPQYNEPQMLIDYGNGTVGVVCNNENKVQPGEKIYCNKKDASGNPFLPEVVEVLEQKPSDGDFSKWLHPPLWFLLKMSHKAPPVEAGKK